MAHSDRAEQPPGGDDTTTIRPARTGRRAARSESRPARRRMPVHYWTCRARTVPDAATRAGPSRSLGRPQRSGLLPKGDHRRASSSGLGGPQPDVIAVETGRGRQDTGPTAAATALADRAQDPAGEVGPGRGPPSARKANRIAVRHPLGAVVAVIEIVSPGNKGSRTAVRAFVDKAIEFLSAGVHLLVIDLFPPTTRDPHGLNNAIADEVASGAVRTTGRTAAVAGRLRRRSASDGVHRNARGWRSAADDARVHRPRPPRPAATRTDLRVDLGGHAGPDPGAGRCRHLGAAARTSHFAHRFLISRAESIA